MKEARAMEAKLDLEFMNASDFAKYIGLSHWRVIQLCKTKQLPAFHFGRNWLISKKVFENHIWEIMTRPANIEVVVSENEPQQMKAAKGLPKFDYIKALNGLIGKEARTV